MSFSGNTKLVVGCPVIGKVDSYIVNSGINENNIYYLTGVTAASGTDGNYKNYLTGNIIASNITTYGMSPPTFDGVFGTTGIAGGLVVTSTTGQLSRVGTVDTSGNITIPGNINAANIGSQQSLYTLSILSSTGVTSGTFYYSGISGKKISAIVVGGGGGGGAGDTSNFGFGRGAGGGGGSGSVIFLPQIFTVSNGNTGSFNYTLGPGGAGGIGATGSVGSTASIIIDGKTYFAMGGAGGNIRQNLSSFQNGGAGGNGGTFTITGTNSLPNIHFGFTGNGGGGGGAGNVGNGTGGGGGVGFFSGGVGGASVSNGNIGGGGGGGSIFGNGTNGSSGTGIGTAVPGGIGFGTSQAHFGIYGGFGGMGGGTNSVPGGGGGGASPINLGWLSATQNLSNNPLFNNWIAGSGCGAGSPSNNTGIVNAIGGTGYGSGGNGGSFTASASAGLPAAIFIWY